MMNSRRDFLQKLAASAMVMPLLSSRPALDKTGIHYPGSQGRVLRVALMGLGGYASRVAEAMQSCKRAKITGLISGTPAKLAEWGAKYNVPETSRYNYENVDNIKDNPDIDAVYVITPNALHHDHVIRVATAGKHAICEKPMALNAKEGKEMVDACANAGVKLLVGYRMHFEPKTLEVIRMRKAGELGKIMFFQGQCGFRIGDPNQWRLDKALAGGGSLMDIGIYAINGARYMVGEDPVWVTAQETKTDKVKFKEGVDETIQFQLGFPSGAVASCLSTYQMNHLDRFFLNGEKGFAEMQPSTGYGPIEGRTSKGKLTQPHTIHQAVQLDEMAGIILDDNKPVVPVDGLEGLKDLTIIDAIYRACATGSRQELHLG
ncbi:Gfo/Idh/MocA family protein [Parapedobacter sp. DT-150]|uniref:Gfo/Idh/MocA family protein n=1 Tax=Parapedobacter sp. DT-150 TaxID=3396162 RepID=UPI003F1D1C28